jgi:hypothetical protein
MAFLLEDNITCLLFKDLVDRMAEQFTNTFKAVFVFNAFFEFYVCNWCWF